MDYNNIYFGHPVDMFDTPIEEELIEDIETSFEADVVNPAEPRHQRQYDERGMDYYTEELLYEVDAGVFLPFEDGTYGAGQTAEIAALLDQYKDVYEIDYSGEINNLIKSLTIDETKNKLDNKSD